MCARQVPATGSLHRLAGGSIARCSPTLPVRAPPVLSGAVGPSTGGDGTAGTTAVGATTGATVSTWVSTGGVGMTRGCWGRGRTVIGSSLGAVATGGSLTGGGVCGAAGGCGCACGGDWMGAFSKSTVDPPVRERPLSPFSPRKSCSCACARATAPRYKKSPSAKWMTTELNIHNTRVWIARSTRRR